MPPSPPNLGIRLVRDFFTRDDKEKIPTDLKTALSLLQLSDLDDLEERFLATDAFLKPWATFRDSIFLLQPDALSRATSITANESDKGISRSDVLWFYTQFDEGSRRYDPRANKYSLEYTSDSSVYGVINKSDWNVDAYEKHLFAWLLQVFKVGKARNPWGFDFFELRNVCSAWETVLVPIVNAVRSSYSVKGRRHYGRLALFIEERCPSALAFPEGNVAIPEGGLMSPTPYRVVSVPKKVTGVDGGAISYDRTEGDRGVLTKKHYDEAEKELRDVYPQYGGLVERPKFKHKMEEWLAEQRARADIRKASEKQELSRSSGQPRAFKRDSSRSPEKNTTATPYKVQAKGQSESPIKRYSGSICRSLSRGMAKMAPKEEPKSPLHGVTRQIHVPDDTTPPFRPQSPTTKHESLTDTTAVTPWPRPDTQRKPSEQSVYTSIRNSNPFNEDVLRETHISRVRSATNNSIFSPMGQLSAIPQPLHRGMERDNVAWPTSTERDIFLPPKKSYADVRTPSYDGSGWEDEISMTKLQTVRQNDTRTPEPGRSAKPPTRLPIPIRPAPYAGHLRVASKDSCCKAPFERPKPVAWPGMTPPIASTWTGLNNTEEFVPPVPPKSPERWNSNRGHVSGSRPQQLARDESHSMARIVSKENIRSALGGISADVSTEDLTLAPTTSMVEGPSRTMSPGGTKLQAYNTNLFPRMENRKGTPVGGWIGGSQGRYNDGRSYEMDVLKGEKRGQED